MAPGGTYLHAFIPTVDMSVFGEYQFTIFTDLAGDEAITNDTMNVTVRHLLLYDLGITDIVEYGTISCDGVLDAGIVIANFGDETITNATIDLTTKGILTQTIDWTGSLATDDSVTIAATFIGALVGNNTVEVAVSYPNGNVDQNASNDQYSTSIVAVLNNTEGVTINVYVPQWASDVTWELTAQNGTVLFSGGPYASGNEVHTTSACLPTGDCYTFTVYDDGCDGFCDYFYGCDGYCRLIGEDGQMFMVQGDYGCSASHSFCIDEQIDIDLGPLLLVTPASSGSLTSAETIQVAIQNFGVLPQTDFNVGYIFEGGTPVIETVSTNLNPEAIYTHTFTPTVNMDAFGSYDITLFTSQFGDTTIFNDTLNVSRAHLANNDASITHLSILHTAICDGIEDLSVDLDIRITNMGVIGLTSADIAVTLDGTPFQNVNWTGYLIPGTSATPTVTLTGLLLGNHSVDVTCSLPNGNTDQVTTNDQLSYSFNVSEGTSVALALTTDAKPEETTWKLADANGVILYAGGPYSAENTLHMETFCLVSDECYVFTIYDSFGDGLWIKNSYDLGSYQIVDGTGSEIAQGGSFTYQGTIEFCLDGVMPCNVFPSINVEYETAIGASDGSITMVAQNGAAPYSYSINGGSTFQTSGVFTDLFASSYSIVVLDSDSCQYTNTVTVTLGPDGIEEPSINAMVLFPNPVTSQLTISTDQHIQQVAITDLRGKTVRTIVGNVTTIDVSDFIDGIYLLQAQTKSGTIRT